MLILTDKLNNMKNHPQCQPSGLAFVVGDGSEARMTWRQWLSMVFRGYWIEEYPNGFVVKTNRPYSQRLDRRLRHVAECQRARLTD